MIIASNILKLTHLGISFLRYFWSFSDLVENSSEVIYQLLSDIFRPYTIVKRLLRIFRFYRHFFQLEIDKAQRFRGGFLVASSTHSDDKIHLLILPEIMIVFTNKLECQPSHNLPVKFYQIVGIFHRFG